ncbi:uncharacterized protein LOC131886325 [Tigriopus californicus]|nr:uncharacterized protein LOC131886325 [Tigriopus californicus]
MSTASSSHPQLPAQTQPRSKKGSSRAALGVLPANVALKPTHQAPPFKVFQDAKKPGVKVSGSVGRHVGVQCGSGGVSSAETQTDLSLLQSDPQAQAESHMYSVDYKALAESRRKSLDEALQENEELKNQRVELVMENEDLKAKVADLEVDVSSLQETLNEQSEAVKDAQEVLAIIGRAVD